MCPYYFHMQTTQEKPHFHLPYLPALDGLRAIAVILVFIYHLPFTSFYLPSGWLGVDVFFVLSGFLITSLLISEYHKSQTINLKNFYIRRFLRLLPALILLLIIVNIISLTQSTEIQQQTQLDSIFALTYTSNWYFAFNPSPPLYLQHTWSLAIEEQYYLFWALIVAVMLAKEMGVKRLMILAIAVALASFIWRLFLIFPLEASHERIYFGLDTRLDGLLLGSALGCFVHTYWYQRIQTKIKDGVNNYLAIASLVALPLMARYGAKTLISEFIIIIPLVNMITLYLILYLIAQPKNRLIAILENPILVRIGKLSYGIYLYHIVIIRIFGGMLEIPQDLKFIIVFILTIILAEISFRLVESPILRLKHRFH